MQVVRTIRTLTGSGDGVATPILEGKITDGNPSSGRKKINPMVIVGLVLLGVLVALFIRQMNVRDPDADLRQKAKSDLSAYIADSPELRDSIKLIDVKVVNGDITAEISAHGGKTYCRLVVDEPSKAVARYHMLAWSPAKGDTAEKVGTKVAQGGTGCISLATMTGIGDGGVLSQ